MKGSTVQEVKIKRQIQAYKHTRQTYTHKHTIPYIHPHTHTKMRIDMWLSHFVYTN